MLRAPRVLALLVALALLVPAVSAEHVFGSQRCYSGGSGVLGAAVTFAGTVTCATVTLVDGLVHLGQDAVDLVLCYAGVGSGC